jgi:hypothetical protein
MPRRIATGVNVTNSLGTLQFNSNRVEAAVTNNNIILDANGTGVVTTPDALLLSANVASTNTLSGTLRVSGGVGLQENLNVGAGINTNNTSGINNIPFGASTPATASFTTLAASGLTTLAEQADAQVAITGATGVVVHNFAVAKNWVHSSIASNFTANFTNVPTTNDRTIILKLFLFQGTTGFLPTAVQIDGAAQTIRWASYSQPPAGNNKQEVATFTLVRSSNSWTVYASLVSHGQTLDGSTAILAAPSALWIRNANPAAASGVYWIDHGSGPYQAYCDMQAGGHILVGKIASTTSSASPWLYNGANWGATTPSNESECTTLTSADGVNRGYYGYTLQSNFRLCLGNINNAITVNISGTNARAVFTGSQRDLNAQLTRGQMLTWFTAGTGTTQTVFDNQPFCNRIGFQRNDSASAQMRFGITMNNENDCNSNDSSVGFGTFTNGQPTGPRAIPAGGHRWSPDQQFSAIGYIFVQ